MKTKSTKLIALSIILNSFTHLFGQINNPAPYCDAVFDNNYNMINSIDIAGTTHNFGPMGSWINNNNYTYYNNVVFPDLVQNQNAQITIDFYSPNDAEPVYYALYIDFDQNNVFDANEIFMHNANTNNADLPTWGAPTIITTLQIPIPATAALGTTRLRLVRGEHQANLYGPFDPAFRLPACHALQGNTYGCAYDFDVNITNTNPAPVLVNTINVQAAGNATTMLNGQTLQLTATVLPITAANANVVWSINNGTGAIDQNGLVTGLTAGTIIITATAADGSGIIGQITITVVDSNNNGGGNNNGSGGNVNNPDDKDTTMSDEYQTFDVSLFIPNAFTPGKSTNNTFSIYSENFETFEMTIFNKFGEIVFISYDKDGEWDGYFAGNLVPQGSYIYKIHYVDANFDKKQVSGVVTVIH